MSAALVDDQVLSDVLRGATPRPLRRADLFTTGYWYVRLCQAVLGRSNAPGVLSAPFLNLPNEFRERAMAAVMELPEEIGLISLRELAPLIGGLRRHHVLNILGMEALAAAKRLDAKVFLSGPSPRLEAALAFEDLSVQFLG